jgi:hypothetical protein
MQFKYVFRLHFMSIVKFFITFQRAQIEVKYPHSKKFKNYKSLKMVPATGVFKNCLLIYRCVQIIYWLNFKQPGNWCNMLKLTRIYLFYLQNALLFN